jgi:hypothetical protein
MVSCLSVRVKLLHDGHIVRQASLKASLLAVSNLKPWGDRRSSLPQEQVQSSNPSVGEESLDFSTAERLKLRGRFEPTARGLPCVLRGQISFVVISLVFQYQVNLFELIARRVPPAALTLLAN